jgi:hypothetical protein
MAAPVEDERLTGRRGRIVAEHDEDAAAHVASLEVVPLILGRAHAVAGEDDLGAHVGGVRARIEPDDIVGEPQLRDRRSRTRTMRRGSGRQPMSGTVW